MNVRFDRLHFVRDWDWVSEHLPLNRSEGNTGLIAYNADTGERLAAMINEDWTPTSVTCHFIVTNPVALRHKFHTRCADYVFNDCGRIKMYGAIKSTNHKAIKLDKHFGFVEVARLRDAYDIGVDSVIMELHRDNCPYWTRPEEARRVANG